MTLTFNSKLVRPCLCIRGQFCAPFQRWISMFCTVLVVWLQAILFKSCHIWNNKKQKYANKIRKDFRQSKPFLPPTWYWENSKINPVHQTIYLIRPKLMAISGLFWIATVQITGGTILESKEGKGVSCGTSSKTDILLLLFLHMIAKYSVTDFVIFCTKRLP